MAYGLIFDVDGLLADTEGLIARATIKMFKDLYGMEFTPPDFRPFIGTGAVRYVQGPAELAGINIDLDRAIQVRHENFVALLESGESIDLPGARALVADAAAHPEWKPAIATSSPGEKSLATLRAARIRPDDFDAYITGDMVTHKKPHPEIYETTAATLELPPDRCIVLEDAVTGVASAKAAGMACVAVTNSFPKEDLGEADLIVSSLADVDLALLRALVA